MNNYVLGGAGIQDLSFNEVDSIGGGTDWGVVAEGLAIMAGGVLTAEVPPVGAALLTVGLHMVAAGLAIED